MTHAVLGNIFRTAILHVGSYQFPHLHHQYHCDRHHQEVSTFYSPRHCHQDVGLMHFLSVLHKLFYHRVRNKLLQIIFTRNTFSISDNILDLVSSQFLL